MARNLKSVEFGLPLGLATNYTPQSTAGSYLLQAQNVDSFDEFRSLGKVPGSTRQSNDHSGTVRSIHQFEYTGLDLVRRREQLSFGNSTLYRINGDKTLTSLQASMADEPLVSATLLDRLHLTSKNQRALPTGGIKYDGTNVRNWGVLAPGQTPTVRHALNDHTLWTINGTNTKANSTASQDGGGSVQVNKVDATVTDVYIDDAGLALNLSAAGQSQLFAYVFLPAGTLQKLATSGAAVEVRIGNSGLGNSDQHTFTLGELSPGWNLLSMVLTAPDSVTGSGATLSAIDTIRLRVIFSGTGQTQSGILWDYIYTVDNAQPTVVIPVDVLEDYESHASYSTNGTNAISTDSGSKTQGAASVSLNKSDATTVNGDIKRTGQTDNYAQSDSQIKIDIYSPTGLNAKLATIGLQVFLARETGITNYNQYDVPKTALTDTAWSTVTIDLTSPDGSGGTGALLTSVDTILVRFIMAAAGNTQAGILVDNLRTNDGGSPSGTYTYRVTYVTENGLESNAGAASAGVSPVNANISLSNIPTSADSQVIARNIYRDISGDSVFRFVARLNDNTTTTFTDTLADASLGSTQPPIAGDALIDNSPPGRMTDFTVYQNRIIGIAADNEFTLIITEAGQPEAARIVDQIQLEERLTAVETHAFGLLVYSTDKVFLLEGDGIRQAFRIEEVTSQAGANGNRSVTTAKAVNFALRENELFLLMNPSDPFLINSPVLDKFQELSDADLANAFMVHDRSRFRLLIFAKAGATFDRIYVYQYGTLGASGQSGDPQDLRQGAWFELSIPAAIDPRCAAIVERTAEKPEVWIGGADGYVYWLQDPSATNYATGVSTAAINAIFETTPVPLGGEEGGRGEPRYLEFNTEGLAGSSTWACTVTLLSGADGKSIGTKTFNVTVATGDTAPLVPIPQFGKRGEWAKVKLQNNVAAEGGIFRSLKLYYVPRSSQRGPRTA